MKPTIYILPILLFHTVLASCSKAPSVVLADNTCEAPCWRGIEVGKTTQEEVLNAISLMSDIQQSTINHQTSFVPMVEEIIYWNFQGVAEINGDLSFHDQTAVMITFNYDQPIMLGEFIQKSGEPSFVYITSSQGPGVYLTVDLIYPIKGICLSHQPRLLPLQNPDQYSFTPQLKIHSVSYIDPAIENGHLTIGCLRGVDSREYQSIVQNWNGYLEYKVHKDGG